MEEEEEGIKDEQGGDAQEEEGATKEEQEEEEEEQEGNVGEAGVTEEKEAFKDEGTCPSALTFPPSHCAPTSAALPATTVIEQTPIVILVLFVLEQVVDWHFSPPSPFKSVVPSIASDSLSTLHTPPGCASSADFLPPSSSGGDM